MSQSEEARAAAHRLTLALGHVAKLKDRWDRDEKETFILEALEDFGAALKHVVAALPK